MSWLDAIDDPYARLRILRELEPVYWSDEIGAWVFTRYDDIARALRDPRWRRSAPDRIDTPTWTPQVPAFASVMGNLFLLMDPPDHTRLRGLVNRAFTPSAIAAIETRIREIVDDLLRALEQRPPFDVITDFAVPLPATVIAELLGVPVSDLPKFKRWSDDFAAVLDLTPDADWPRLETSAREFAGYVLELASDRREARRDDLLSALASRHEGDTLTERSSSRP
jgi:cytochrome P450